MGRSVTGNTPVDWAVADYLRSLLGDQISTEGWEIDASRAGDVPLLRVHITMPFDHTLAVIAHLLPHVQGFSAHLARHKDEPGVRISAALMINAVDIVKIMAARLESDNKE